MSQDDSAPVPTAASDCSQSGPQVLWMTMGQGVCSSVSITTNYYLSFFSVINPTIKLKWLEANWTAD